MKVTLCIAIALVAVASAAPFEWPKTRRVAGTACGAGNGAAAPTWCKAADAGDASNTFPCQCATSGDCNGPTKYCETVAAGGLKTQCPIDGTTAIKTANAACICGAPDITKPASAAATGSGGDNTFKIAFSAPATDAAPQFCLLNKDGTNANKRISADTCPTTPYATTSTNLLLNTKVTCGNNQDINACVSGKVCAINGQDGGVCLDVCTPTSATAAGTAAGAAGCACGSQHLLVTNGKYCGIKANGQGVILDKKACSTANSAGTVDVGTTADDRCNCGTDQKLETDGTNKYCSVTGVVGAVYPNPVCTAAQGAGTTDQSGSGTSTPVCNCGSAGAAKPTTSSKPYCVLAATGGGGSIFAKKICSTANSAGTVDVGTTAGDRCNCGTAAELETDGTNKYCSVTGTSGAVYPNPVCTAAQGAGTTDQSGSGTSTPVCNCGSAGAAKPTTSSKPYCVLAATGGGGSIYATAQCGGTTATADQGTGAAKVTANCQCGTTAIGDAADTCKYCYAAANYVGTNGAIVDCATKDGSAASGKGPNKCKCSTEACATTEVCYTDASFTTSGKRYCRTASLGVLATCKNAAGNADAVDGSTAAGDDCLCGTAKINKNQYCIASINAANTAQLGNCFGVNGRISVAAGVACKCGPTTGARSDDICTVGQFCDGSQAGTGNSGANGKCLTTALAAPAADTTYGVSTITQAVTFSGLTAAQWTGGLKTAGEIGYAQAQGWTTGAGAAVDIAPGFTVTSTAARRAATVTFTSTLQASPTVTFTSTLQ